MNIFSRGDAIAAGKTRYFTGKPCKRGHVSERMVSTLTCVHCKQEREKNEYAGAKRSSRLSKSNKWNSENRSRMNARAVVYQTERRKSDPLYAFQSSVKSMVAGAIGRRGHSKSARTHEILGCSIEFFRTHIERQFLPGMSWANRSLWHIDHIVALATAVTEADVIALNHFTNLRPLWIPDNLKKGAKQTHLL